MFRRGAFILMALALFAGACSSGDGRDSAVKQLTDEGFSQEAAECVVDEVDASGLSPSEFTAGGSSPKSQKAMEDALRKCASAEDLGNLLQDVSLDDQAVREQFVSGLVRGAGGTIDRAEAECITDYIVEQNVSIADMSKAGLEGDLPPEMQDLINAAVDACVST